MGTGCFITTGRSLDQAVERVKLAESLGYDCVYVTHIAGRESLTVLSVYAMASSRIRVGSGVVPIYTRTPATMAQTAATIDELSGGRLTLGLGVSHRPVVEGWHGQTIERPVAEMREYAAIVRAMLRLAGEIADGVILWLCNPSYIRDVVIPEVSAGRERAGLTLEGFDVVAAVPAALSDDRHAVFQAMRKDLIPYFGLPFYRAMIERTGYGADIAAYDSAAGDIEAMASAISEGFLEELTAVGDEAAVGAGLQRYRQAGAGSPCVGPIAGTDFEATLRAGVG